MKKIYHIINPYKVDESAAAFVEQQKTLDTLFTAINFVGSDYEVKLVMKVSQGDYEYFNELYSKNDKVFLCKLATDSSEIDPPFSVRRELPLLNDLLDLSELSGTANKDDLVVVTNMDICVQPFFYMELFRIHNTGKDVFVINRRTIPKELMEKELIDAYVSNGDQHIGHDCFVFPFKLLDKFDIRDHILGIGFVFRPFLLNCVLHAKCFDELDDAYLTFHYGDDMEWKNEKYNDYLEHNKQKLIAVYRDNKELVDLARNNEMKMQWMDKFFNFTFLESK